MKQYTVSSVERHGAPDHWRVNYQVSDGTLYCHVFPPSTLAWRAAEYGIDPNDTSTLLDVVLHEMHMAGHDHTSPDFVYNTDVDTARTALNARVTEVKTRIQIHDPHGHLSQIRSAHEVDPADHAAKTAHADHIRRHGIVNAPQPAQEADHG